MKTCSRCEQAKPLTEFHCRGATGRRHPWCKTCCKEYNRDYRQKNLERLRKQNRDGHKRRRLGDPNYYKDRHDRAYAGDPDYYRRNSLRFNFGMTLEDYEAKLEAQGGVCAVCGSPPGERHLQVDHDHACCPGSRSCGRCIRALLCGGCNGGTGIVDNPELLRAKAAYLMGWQQRFSVAQPNPTQPGPSPSSRPDRRE